MHCGTLFGTYFGSTTGRSQRQPSYRHNPRSNDPQQADQNPSVARQHEQGSRQMVTAISGVHDQLPWGSENLSMGPGSLNSNMHPQLAQHMQRQKLTMKLSAPKPPPIDVDAMSSMSSGSAHSASAKAGETWSRRRSDSLPSSPTKQHLRGSDRGSREMPWLQTGRQNGPAEKTLQKHKNRCQLLFLTSMHFRTTVTMSISLTYYAALAVNPELDMPSSKTMCHRSNATCCTCNCIASAITGKHSGTLLLDIA